MRFLWNHKLMILVSSFLMFWFVSLVLCHIIIWTNYNNVFCDFINMITLKMLTLCETISFNVYMYVRYFMLNFKGYIGRCVFTQKCNFNGSWTLVWDPSDLMRLTPKQKCYFDSIFVTEHINKSSNLDSLCHDDIANSLSSFHFIASIFLSDKLFNTIP